ncbi:MAG: ATP-binding cassette domain-containing protein, partial [Desulfamplus sp.]|nr:ATP-binding cassette domain-containing protein [Desulfamplus sp.]
PLYHNMLVYDYLCYVAKIRKIKNEHIQSRLKELSELCGLSSIMHKSIYELSKGLKQRVGLAHAMMSDPEILILDEPTSGLDPNQIAEIRQIIKRIGKEKTIIFSTHILSEAEATCDRIVIINKGKIVADDSTQTLKNRASSNSNIQLSLYSDGVDSDQVVNHLKSLTTEIDVITKESAEKNLVSFDIYSSSSKDLRRDIYLKIKERDWIIAQLTQKSQTLESIFHELTKGD